MLMQKEFMRKLSDNVLYSENENGMRRLKALEDKQEEVSEEIACRLTEFVKN